jgi:methylenetetrahydrofolate dehydrogenase (NADP+) / methenyltetrahydrofolate cyclohydrolase
MKAIIFDGKKFAEAKEQELKHESEEISGNLARKLKLVAFLNIDNKASVVYTNIKKKMADRLGVEFETISVAEPDFSRIAQLVQEKNVDPTVDGIMVQMPISNSHTKNLEIASLIDPDKDVDGLTGKGRFLPATVAAVLQILHEAMRVTNKTMGNIGKVVVVGSFGTVGRPLILELQEKGFDVAGIDRETLDIASVTRQAEVVISCTGKEGLIKGDMVRDGVIAIDVGYPGGDIDFSEVANKASFITPVPGGVGPVTVISLFSNLISKFKN